MSIRRLNRFLLRLFPFVIFMAWLIELICSWYNLSLGWVYNNTFGISLITIIPLWLAVECDCKYNCKHIRWMYGCILLCQLINMADYVFNIFHSYELLFECAGLIIIITFLALFSLSIRHFFIKSK